MTLKYFQGAIDGFTNKTDEFIVLIGYKAYINNPLVAGENVWSISVNVGSEAVDDVGENIIDNGLTMTYVQLSSGDYHKRHLLIPPGGALSVTTTNSFVETYGEFIQGTLEEVAKLL